MFSYNFLAVFLVAAQFFAPTFTAPLSVSSTSSPHVIKARQTQYNQADCMMQRSDMTLNLAGAMNTITSVQSTVNTSDVRTVQDGIMGAMTSLALLTGAQANGARIDISVPNAMVNNVTMSINALDNVAGVPDTTTAEQLTVARQQLENASQGAMGVAANCINYVSGTTPAPTITARPTASATSAASASETASAMAERRRRRRLAREGA